MVETIEIINAARIVVQKKLSIYTYTGKNEVSHTDSSSMAALMTSVNSPNVRHVTGNDNRRTIGRTNEFTSPKTTETTSNAAMISQVSGVTEAPRTSMPGRIHIATQHDAAVTRTRNR